jgi:polysaccharide pyruvyl transferase WcaK-like protein
MLHRLRPASPARCLRRIVALRRDAARVRAGHEPTDPLHAPMLAALHGAVAVVAPGAGWFTSKYRIEQMLPRLAEVEAARVLGVPFLFESGTVGPFEGVLDRRLARRMISGLHRLTVRDGPRSADTARSLGATDVAEVPDAATAFEPGPAADRDAWLTGHGVDPSRPYAVVSIRDTRDPTAVGDSDATFDTLVAALGVVAERGIQAVFLPHCIAPETDDRPAGRAVAERAPLLVHDDMAPDEVAVAMIHGAALAVGNRFHLALVADAAGTPALFLAATPFDDLRAGAFTGGNVAVVRAQPGGTAGAAAATERIERGHGPPGPRWDPAELGRALQQLLDRR